VAGKFGEKHKHQLLIMEAISTYVKPFLDDERRKDRANRSILQTLTRHLGPTDEALPEILSSEREAKESAVVSAYLALASLCGSLSQCEYYFRRYPFKDLPVSHADHLRNVCEMYFDRIEQFRARLKILVNSLKNLTEMGDERYGKLIKTYEKHFKWECRQRNLTHHHRRFEYDAIDQLGLIDLLRLSEMAPVLPEPALIYRQESRKWVKRVRAHHDVLLEVVDYAASLVLEKCLFLNAKIVAV
jgi:hypothetical protein